MSFHTKGATYPRNILDLMFHNKHITEEQYHNMMECCEPDNKESFIPSPSSRSYIWETFDSLFKTIYKQGKMLTQIEKRISDLENKMKNGNNSMS